MRTLSTSMVIVVFLLSCVSVTSTLKIPANKAGTSTFADSMAAEQFDGAAPEDTLSFSIADSSRIDSFFWRPDSLEEYDTLAFIASLLEEATYDCEENDFPAAHAVLQQALRSIENQNLLFDEQQTQSFDIEDTIHSDSDQLNHLMQKLLHIYAALMPHTYLDSISSSLANQIFQLQITQAIDTLSLSPNDTDMLANLINCENGIPYNVPIAHNWKVQKVLIIFSRQKEALENLISRARYYLPMTQAIFLQNQIPTDLCYLPIVESGYNPRAYSPAHASGMWQFIPSTGQLYGLKKNFWLDERNDPIKSTYAAIAYLKKLYNQFNDWYLALAAYNCGENRVEQSMQTCSSADYWSLSLPRETMNYVPQFIAYMIVGKNPRCFGLNPTQRDTFDLDTVVASESVDLHKIATKIDIPYKKMKELNPHILHFCTPPAPHTVTLYVPAGKGGTVAAYLKNVPDKDKVRWVAHQVKKNEKVTSIASRYHISTALLKSTNRLKRNSIRKGTTLFIPVAYSAPLKSSETEPFLAEEEITRYENDSSQEDFAEAVKDKPAHSLQKDSRSAVIKYKVSSGETVSDIADLFDVSIRDVCRWNNLHNPRKIKSGTILLLYKPHGFIPEKRESLATTSQSRANHAYYTVKKGDNLFRISRNLNISLDDLARWNNKNRNRPRIYPGERLIYYRHGSSSERPVRPSHKTSDLMHRVKKGDTLTKVATRYCVDLAKLQSYNRLSRSAVIQPGDILRIPVK